MSERAGGIVKAVFVALIGFCIFPTNSTETFSAPNGKYDLQVSIPWGVNGLIREVFLPNTKYSDINVYLISKDDNESQRVANFRSKGTLEVVEIFAVAWSKDSQRYIIAHYLGPDLMVSGYKIKADGAGITKIPLGEWTKDAISSSHYSDDVKDRLLPYADL